MFLPLLLLFDTDQNIRAQKHSVLKSLRERDCIWLHTLHSNASTVNKFNQSLAINVVLEGNAN